ncbi:unnamed protein product [Adineta steineri]|uniref:Methyltransferase FkbM domain-containing protein n=1 Tax=Adineta steineri TaxID=433720 RepID=A0A815SVP0_9BILA|nr:unnamed protein product [Adineta steineri]CAF4088665.1 unnamed protein product [Adineta steineri]
MKTIKDWGRWIRPGSIAIDIGTHSGDTTVPFAVSAAMTIGFEPNPAVYKMVQANRDANPELSIKIHQYGVASRAYKDTWSYGCNGGADDKGLTELNFHVELVVLSDFLEKNYSDDVIANISFIKIDTEGYDMYILDTLEPIFKKTKERPIIFIEWFVSFKKDKNLELLSHIEKINYVAYDPERGRKKANLNVNDREYHDLILFPKERLNELIRTKDGDNHNHDHPKT